MLRSLNKAVMIASALVVAVAFFKRNDLPGSIDFHAKLKDAPRQREIHKPPLRVQYAGVEYRVEPLYDYELYGLVVSYRQHDGESFMHRWSNDHLNMADVCVIWGESARSEHLGKLRFWNGIFTCNVQTRDSEAWASFRLYELANNHLISADPRIRDRVADVRIGDQIRIRGSLARYGAVGTFSPGIALHARGLTFLHPVRYEPITLTAEVPREWRARFAPLLRTGPAHERR